MSSRSLDSDQHQLSSTTNSTATSNIYAALRRHDANLRFPDLPNADDDLVRHFAALADNDPGFRDFILHDYRDDLILGNLGDGLGHDSPNPDLDRPSFLEDIDRLFPDDLDDNEPLHYDFDRDGNSFPRV